MHSNCINRKSHFHLLLPMNREIYMFKRLMLVGSCLAAMLSAGSVIAAEPTYVVGSGGTYRSFVYENS